MIISVRQRLSGRLWAFTALAAAVLAGALSLAPAGASTSPPAHAARPLAHSGPAFRNSGVIDVCTANLFCMHDPSDGGAGTTVVTSSRGNSNAEDWIIYPDFRCSQGNVSPTCPGGWISQNYDGKPLVVISNYGASGGSKDDCVKTNSPTWQGVIGSCDSGTTNEISSAYVEVTSPSADCASNFCFVSVKYGQDNRALALLCSSETLGQPVYAGLDHSNGIYCEWTVPVS